jgi:hypothetical protein
MQADLSPGARRSRLRNPDSSFPLSQVHAEHSNREITGRAAVEIRRIVYLGLVSTWFHIWLMNCHTQLAQQLLHTFFRPMVGKAAAFWDRVIIREPGLV